jgi:peptidoglycan/LPS O-acetylase OafA/YrhL
VADSRLIQVPGERLGHIPAFDGFRGLFVLQVVAYHAALTDFLRGSPIVIDWFFVASGFLITSLLLDETNRSGDIALRRFYTRRALRLFPAMYAMLAVFTVFMLVLHLVIPDQMAEAGAWWLEPLAASFYVYFLVAAFFPATFGLIGHTWSLTVEEQFYFVWPLVLRRTLRKATRRADRNLIVGCIVFIVLFITLRVWLQDVVRFDGGEVEFVDAEGITWRGVVYRIAAVRPDMIVLGCLTAFAVRRIPRPVPPELLRWSARLGALSWVAYVGFICLGNRVPGFELFGGVAYQVALLTLPLMIVDLYFRPRSPMARLVSLSPLRWLGQRSYGIYLWHIPVLLPFLPAINDSFGVRRLALGTVAALLGIGAGLLSFRYVETPFLRIKETRFFAPQDAMRRDDGDRSPVPADPPETS